MHLAELIFPFTSVIVPTPSYKCTLKTLDTRVPPLRLPYIPKHCVFHLSSAFHHIYTPHVDFSLVNKGNNKLPNSVQPSKGKVKTHKYIKRQNQSTTGKL